MNLPDGATLGYGEKQRIEKALADLAKDPFAPRTVTVGVVLHIHQEYPKHVAGRIVNNAEEEAALTSQPPAAE